MLTTPLIRAKVAVATSALMISALNPGAHPNTPVTQPVPAAARTVAMAVELTASITPDGSTQTVGVADAYLYTLNQTELVTQLTQIRSLGVTDLRIVVPWVYIQPTSAAAYDWSKMDNVINTANSMGFSLTASITGNPTWDGTPLVGAPNPNAYATFAAAVAQRYNNQISAYEIWNEPNAVTFFAPSDPTAYTAVLKAAYTAIKAVAPNSAVIAGVLGAVTTVPGMSLAPQQFLAGMYAAGAQGFFDALSFHPYNYTLPFSAGAGVANSPLEQVKALYALMTANGDAAKQIWATEFGNPTMPGGISQAQQAQMLRDFVTAWSKLSFAGPAYVYTARDLNTGFLLDENNMGLFTTNGLPKLAAETLATIIKQLATGTLPHYTAPQMPAAQTIWVQLVSLAISVTNQALFIPNIATQILYNAAPAALQHAFSTVARAVSLSVGQTLNAITPAAETGIGMLINFPTNAHAAATALGASFYGTERTVQRALASIGIGAVPNPTSTATSATAAVATTTASAKRAPETPALDPTSATVPDANTTTASPSPATRTEVTSSTSASESATASTTTPSNRAAPKVSTTTPAKPAANSPDESATPHQTAPVKSTGDATKATAGPTAATSTKAAATPATSKASTATATGPRQNSAHPSTDTDANKPAQRPRHEQSTSR